MKSFLEHVAEDLLSRYGTNLSRVAVVFPNKRASLFLNEHLARLAQKPLWSPAYITISDLFRSHSKLQVADPILLVCELHRVFTACTGIDETLDHFYGWGQLLLSDFDDLDKNMAPADKVLANLRDIHELDDTSYLTPEQREMIKRFFSNFSEEHNSELKERFLHLWSHIGDIYHQFNQKLAEQQLAYEGALYRQVATDETLEFEYDTYVFIGFNLLQQVEQTLFSRLEKQGKAIFYQDTAEVPPCHINLISAPTENIQARYISEWLDADRINDGRKTAIVLCNEGLLQTVIHCLPENVDKINITTGYPLGQTSIASLINTLINMQVHGYSLRKQTFARRWVESIKRHPYATLMPNDFASQRYTDIQPLLHWLISLTQTIATSKSPIIDSPLDTESLFRMYTLLNRLSGLVDSGDLQVDVITLQRLIVQLISTTSIPFHGEPAEGIQVMGVLETRNLDFDHVLLLSCNEGNMPRGVNDTSFIPYALRKAYGLTTIDYKVSIYEHYFHRLLQRAKDVTILYNNATSDGKTAEMSRFMLQLMVENKIPISYQSLKAGQTPQLHAPKVIEKTPEVMLQMQKRFEPKRGGISPTAINTYLRCQLRFFYHYVCELIEPDTTEDDLIDNRLFGNIFHKAAQLLYQNMTSTTITSMMLDDLLKEAVTIERTVDEAIKQEFFKINDPSRPLPPLDGLQLINREVIIKYLRQLVEADRRLTPFRILGLEKWVDIHIGGWKIGGIIDRLDSITDPETGEERIRVIDYKTGARHLKAMPDVEAIFSQEAIKDHSDYFLQAFLYAHIIRSNTAQPVSPCLLFIQHAGSEDYDPTLKLGKETVTDIATYADAFIALFKRQLDEMFNPQISFCPTDDRHRCESCPYASLCRG
ncbi:PD-(D/E)XK nuclease family protein [Prevotella sp. P6B4]|uniref:PD-(D/E)XK nuclease family protein n=1 Tax=Prevotella sp. P6B4 TaxID=1410614 RepID=UPI00048CCEA2|nr:PD-(D/E)XK nuclease family protein [Prevotella sp. P6B4]